MLMSNEIRVLSTLPLFKKNTWSGCYTGQLIIKTRLRPTDRPVKGLKKSKMSWLHFHNFIGTNLSPLPPIYHAQNIGYNIVNHAKKKKLGTASILQTMPPRLLVRNLRIDRGYDFPGASYSLYINALWLFSPLTLLLRLPWSGHRC
jgi:hypothetical protein